MCRLLLFAPTHPIDCVLVRYTSTLSVTAPVFIAIQPLVRYVASLTLDDHADRHKVEQEHSGAL